MKSFGPYTYAQAKQIEEVLSQNGAQFEKEVDEDVLKEARQRHAEADNPYHAHDHNYACVFFSMEDDVLMRLAKELEPFGISLSAHDEPPTFDEEYGCKSCDYRSKTRGNCPTHHTPLLSDDEWFDHNRDKPSNLVGWLIAAVVVGGLAVFFWMKRYSN